MLVLTRQLWQRIRLKIGDRVIWVQYADLDRGKIRLAFHADKDVQIFREEVLKPEERFQAQEAAARVRAAQAAAHGSNERMRPLPGHS